MYLYFLYDMRIYNFKFVLLLLIIIILFFYLGNEVLEILIKIEGMRK